MGSSLPPTMSIQTALTALKGNYEVRMTVPTLVPFTVAFKVYLAVAQAPSVKFGF